MQRALILAALVSAPITVSARPAPGRAPDVVQIKTQDGLNLQGSFYKPVQAGSPAVLLVHDAGADRKELETIAEKLAKQGFGVLTIDLRAHGESKTPKLDWSQLSDADKKSTWSFGVRDVDAAAGWLLERPEVHSTSLSLVGHGAGCALVARHARNDENVRCMVLLAPRPEDYGFDLRADIQTLEGLETFVATTKNEAAERMVEEANALASSNPYIELFYAGPKSASLLEDKQLPARVAKWVTDKAMPKKGRD